MAGVTPGSSASHQLVGVQFAGTHRLQLFDARGLVLQVGDLVFVRSMEGVELGEVVVASSQIVAAAIEEEVLPVVRVAGSVSAQQRNARQLHVGEARWTIEAEAARFVSTPNRFPLLGSQIETGAGPRTVSATDIKRGKVTATTEDGEEVELSWSAASDDTSGPAGAK